VGSLPIFGRRIIRRKESKFSDLENRREDEYFSEHKRRRDFHLLKYPNNL